MPRSAHWRGNSLRGPKKRSFAPRACRALTQDDKLRCPFLRNEESKRACHPERRRREEPALSVAKGSVYPALTENRRQRAAEARQDLLAEEPVGLVQGVLSSVCSVDSRQAAFRIDHPHQQRTG